MMEGAVNQPTRQKPYHHGDLRHALLESALEQLAEGDSAPLNFRQLAVRLGVSHSAIYRHFPDKQALIDALAEHGFGQLSTRFSEAVQKSADTTHIRLLALARTYVHFALDEPILMRVMFSGVSSDRKTLPSLKRAAGTALDALRTLVEAAQARGELVGDDPLGVTLTYWAALHGLAELLTDDQLSGMVAPAQTDTLIETTVEHLLSGTLRRSGAAQP